jgi:alkanesulfonate monooxygenase SsuD/methylene tetrahydromethanopterin reductase-like flavin-dependent oxidoreductase (luciferase family)
VTERLPGAFKIVGKNGVSAPSVPERAVAEAAGYAEVWAWDHFVGMGDRSVPVVRSTVLSAAAATTRTVTVGPFVIDVMNRHPAVLARMATTLQVVSGGRLILGMGIGGNEPEHRALGIPFPEAPERVARLEEAVAVLRALWAPGPVPRPSPFSPLEDAIVSPLPLPPPPILIGGGPGPGPLAGRIGDGWSAFDTNFEANLPPRGARGQRPATRGPARDRRVPGRVLVERRDAGRGPWVEAPRETWARWQAAGADGAVVTVGRPPTSTRSLRDRPLVASDRRPQSRPRSGHHGS